MNVHKTPANLVVHTGVRGPSARKLQNHLLKHGDSKGLNVIQHGYTSTSLRPSVAKNFADFSLSPETSYHDKNGEKHTHSLKIHVPKGHPGAYIEHLAVHEHEREFILPRNTKLHIHAAPEIEHKLSNPFMKAHHHYTWTAHIAK